MQQIIDILIEHKVLFKDTKQFTLSQSLTLISLKSSVLFSHENLLWVVLSLRRDKIRFTVDSVLKRIKAAFETEMNLEDLYEIFEDFFQIKKKMNLERFGKLSRLSIDKTNDGTYSVSLENCDEDTFEDQLRFKQDDPELIKMVSWIHSVFQENLMTLNLEEILNQSKKFKLKKENLQEQQQDMHFLSAKESNSSEGFSNILKFDKTTFSLDHSCSQPHAEEHRIGAVKTCKVFPGGIYGLALYTKHFHNGQFEHYSLGKLVSLIRQCVEFHVIKYYKTFLVKNELY